MSEVDENVSKSKLLIWVVATSDNFNRFTFNWFVFVKLMVVKLACFVINLAKQGFINVYLGIKQFAFWIGHSFNKHFSDE